MPDEKRYWFPAKRYGWGWGLPRTWQGWLVLALYALGWVVAWLLFPPRGNAPAYIWTIVALTALLVLVCWLKGEPPRWRWGGRRE